MRDLDPVLFHRARLSICAALIEVESVSFPVLADVTGLSDSLLSRHLATLVSAGYVASTKDYRAQGARVWVRLTPAGIAAMDALVEQIATVGARRSVVEGEPREG